jgi:hypothetical protein
MHKPRWLVVGVLFLAGCGGAPRAPALEDGPVYDSPSEHFRFLVPESWTQFARAEAPPGKVEQECMLVEYKLLTAERPAGFQVTRADLAESTDLRAYLVGHAPSSEHWQPKGPAQPGVVRGVDAVRVRLVGHPSGKEEFTREVTAFRRGERVYFFTGKFASSDAEARRQIRRAVESIIWTR